MSCYAWSTNDSVVALARFRDEEVRSRFSRYFRQFQETYEILAPDAFLMPYLDDYAALTALYQTVRAAYEPYAAVDRSLGHKSAERVQQYTTTGAVGAIRTFTDLGP